MNKQLIFIVEDDDGIKEVYQGALEELYDVELFSDGKSFFDRFYKQKPSFIILDIMLPDMDGFTILTKIREIDQKLPVIIVSAKVDEISFVKGLNKGADDYMAKPFSILELLARIKTNLRRVNLNISNYNGFTIDNNTYSVYYNDKKLELTLKEFYLLKTLIYKTGITISRDELLNTVWGEDYYKETRTLDIHIAQLRDKIKNAGGENCIITVRGVGYRFE
jgi:DNA-binding response OmpR family regulator